MPLESYESDRNFLPSLIASLGGAAVGIIIGLATAAIVSSDERNELREFKALKEELATLRVEKTAQENALTAMSKKVSDLELDLVSAQDLVEGLEYTNDKLTSYAMTLVEFIESRPELKTELDAVSRAEQPRSTVDSDPGELILGRSSHDLQSISTEVSKQLTWTVSDGLKYTDSFTTTSDQWKISWQIEGDSFYFKVGIYRDDGQGINGEGTRIDSIHSSQSDSSIVRAAPGRYYLRINAIATDVTVSVSF